MAVRVKVELLYKHAKSVGVAIANSGYESSRPEIIIPFPFAKERLKIKVKWLIG